MTKSQLSRKTMSRRLRRSSNSSDGGAVMLCYGGHDSLTCGSDMQHTCSARTSSHEHIEADIIFLDGASALPSLGYQQHFLCLRGAAQWNPATKIASLLSCAAPYAVNTAHVRGWLGRSELVRWENKR
ncbi:hypothetical protein MRB53_038929 [Persea americana]|nr:hypothetical protein MRB53_038929 [Persea americana]